MLDFTLPSTLGPLLGLAALFLASFLSATVLPGGSEAVLIAAAYTWPDALASALILATLGNTLGGMTSYAMGRMLKTPALPARAAWLQRFGSPALVLSWVPVVGDALCVAAGWLRLDWRAAALWMLVGKAARYGAVLGLLQLA